MRNLREETAKHFFDFPFLLNPTKSFKSLVFSLDSPRYSLATQLVAQIRRRRASRIYFLGPPLAFDGFAGTDAWQNRRISRHKRVG